MLIAEKIFQDQSSAKKYLQSVIGAKPLMTYNDFLSVFVKGILKGVVCGIYETVKDYKRKDEPKKEEIPDEEKQLLWQLSGYRRENLLGQIENGMVKHKDDKQMTVKRPVFENLYNLKYRGDPEKWKNASYEKFLNGIREHPKVEDENRIEDDQFADKICLVSNDFFEDIEAYDFLKLGNREQEVFDDMQLDSVINEAKMLSLQDKSSKIRDYIFRKANNTSSSSEKDEHKRHNNYVDVPLKIDKNQQQENLIDKVCHKTRREREKQMLADMII